MNRKTAMDFINELDPDTAESIAQARKMSPELVDVFVERLYGDAYQRDKLALRERFLITLAALIAGGNMDAALATQARLALRFGLSREELMEIGFQVSVYSGFGVALTAMRIIDAVADQLELES